MRCLLLAMFSCALSAAELEQITTTDGRRLIGTYDDVAGVLVLDGPGAASIKLPSSQVKARSPFIRPPEPQAAEPRQPAKAQPQQATVEEAIIAADKLRAQAKALETAALLSWFKSLDKEPLPFVEPKDPRESEKRALKLIKWRNSFRERLREREQFITGTSNDAARHSFLMGFYEEEKWIQTEAAKAR